MTVTATLEHHQIVLRSRDHGEVFAVTIAPPDALAWRATCSTWRSRGRLSPGMMIASSIGAGESRYRSRT